MTASDPRLVVRCFAKEDEGLVDEWPVALAADEVRVLVKGADGEIRPIDRATAEKLAGRALPEFVEEVVWFVEPRLVATDAE